MLAAEAGSGSTAAGRGTAAKAGAGGAGRAASGSGTERNCGICRVESCGLGSGGSPALRRPDGVAFDAVRPRAEAASPDGACAAAAGGASADAAVGADAAAGADGTAAAGGVSADAAAGDDGVFSDAAAGADGVFADGAAVAGDVSAADAAAGAAGKALGEGAAGAPGAGAGNAFVSAAAVGDGVAGFGVGLAAGAGAGSFGPAAASALLRSATRLWVSFCRSAVVVARVGGGGTLARFGYEAASPAARLPVNGALCGSGSFLSTPVKERHVSTGAHPPRAMASVTPRARPAIPVTRRAGRLPDRDRALRNAIREVPKFRSPMRPPGPQRRWQAVSAKAPAQRNRHNRTAAIEPLCIRSRSARHYI